MSNVESSIVAFIDEMQPGGDTIAVSSDTKLLETGLIDSLGLVKLIQFVEQHFGISIPDADVTPDIFASPAQLAAYVIARAT